MSNRRTKIFSGHWLGIAYIGLGMSCIALGIILGLS